MGPILPSTLPFTAHHSPPPFSLLIHNHILVDHATLNVQCTNLVSFTVFFIGIDQHDIYVIEADGVEIAPYKLDVITAAVAQRYSILVTAKNETNVNYAMSVMQSPDM